MTRAATSAGPPDAAVRSLRQIQRRVQQLSRSLELLLLDLDQDLPSIDPPLEGVARTEAILHILDTHAGPLAPVEIWRSLRNAGYLDDKTLVRVTTYELWRRGRLVKVGEAQYCHPDHVPAGAARQEPARRAARGRPRTAATSDGWRAAPPAGGPHR